MPVLYKDMKRLFAGTAYKMVKLSINTERIWKGDYEGGYFERGRDVAIVFDRRGVSGTREEEESLRTKPRVSSCSVFRFSSENAGRVRRMDVTERRRLCTTTCIFGNSDLRTVFTKFC